MTTIAKIVFVCCALGSYAGSAYAQDEAGATPVALTSQSSLFDRIQAREAARAAKIRKEWLAAGHTIEPGADPKITAGKILTPTMNAAKQPAAPEYSVTFKTGPSGLSYIEAYFDSPGDQQYIYVDYSPPPHSPPITSGTLKIRQPGYGYSQGMFDPFSIPGTWSLVDIYIYDQASHYTLYGQQQVATLFPSTTIEVANNEKKADGVAPLVSAAKVLTPTVKLSSTYPVFRTELTVSDDLSGVRAVSVSVRPPDGGETMYGDNDPPAPVKSGKLAVSTYLGTSPKTGTWTITEYEICDVATNCVYDSSASDIQALFGTTTFKVKN